MKEGEEKTDTIEAGKTAKEESTNHGKQKCERSPDAPENQSYYNGRLFC